MKNLIVLLLIAFVSGKTFAQNQSKTLYGSFVFDQQVFQYKYKKDGSIHSLNLSTLAQPNPMSDLDNDKFKRTELFLKDATTLTSSNKLKDSFDFLKKASDSTLLLIAQLPQYLEQLKNIHNNRSTWKEQLKNIDKLIDVFDKYEIEKVKLGDTLAKDIYSPKKLLLMYKNFLQNIAEPQASQEIPFPELKEPDFQNIFITELGQLYLKGNLSFDKLKPSALTLATQIMYEIKARAEFNDDEPTTAFIALKRKYIDIDFEIPIKNPKNSPATRPSNTDKKDTIYTIQIPFEIKMVYVEFEDGAIKNIFADLLPLVSKYKQIYGTNTIRFRNNKPISITGKFDSDEFKNHKIYAGNTLELMSMLYDEARIKIPDSIIIDKDELKKRSFNAYFILSNVLDYKVATEIDNEDYSPTNSKIELSEPNSHQGLKKEKRSKILSSKIYSDFMGLTNDQPNGLVQIEVSKRINLVSGRAQGFFKGIDSKNQKGRYAGGLTYIEPRFTISKIEENNRYLSLDSSQLDRNKSLNNNTKHFFLNPLEVLRYQQWSFGMDLNIYKLNLQNRKSNFQINGSFIYGRTSVADSLEISQNQIIPTQTQNVSRINTTTWGLSIQYEVKPDSRYGFSFGYDFRWMDLNNNQFEYNTDFKNSYHTAWFNGFFKVNNESKLFWRFRKHWLTHNNTNNFYQIQFGYELDIFKGAN